jgi:hypothetical protein
MDKVQKHTSFSLRFCSVECKQKGGWIRYKEFGTRCNEACVGDIDKEQFICEED